MTGLAAAPRKTIIQAIVSMPSRRPAARFLSAARSAATPSAETVPSVALTVQAYLAGEAGAGERLVEEFHGVVREAIARFLALWARGRADLVDDLTNEVFVALLRDDGRKLRTFAGRHGCSFAGWLRVVAVRLTIDRLRRETRLMSLDDDTAPMEDLRRRLQAPGPDPERALQGRETVERLLHAVEGLADKDRLLAELHLVRGAPLEDVARALGVSMNAAYVRKSRLLDRLRRALGGVA